MLLVSSTSAVLARYGAVDGPRVVNAVNALGTVIDGSGRDETEIRREIDARDPSRTLPVCLIGDYELVPTFRMSNPTRRSSKEVDQDVMTDAPYGARPGQPEEAYLPSRAVSRLPVSSQDDADAFVALLARAAAAPTIPTPPGTFQHAADEFGGSADLVHAVLPGVARPLLSPPARQGNPALGPLASGRGRQHILLHGSAKHPGRATLWGRSAADPSFVSAMSAADLMACNLRGAIMSFSSCYSAMLDSLATEPPRRTDDQVALACLAGGAKVVYGATRANWIDITVPIDSFGAALVANIWRRLQDGEGAAEALRAAKFDYARIAFAGDFWTRPFVLKTLLQMQCYGHPLARL